MGLDVHLSKIVVPAPISVSSALMVLRTFTRYFIKKGDKKKTLPQSHFSGVDLRLGLAVAGLFSIPVKRISKIYSSIFN